MSSGIWWRLTAFGDSAIVFPIAFLIALWLLLVPATRRTGWSWLGAVALTTGGVVVSKLLYMGFGLHPPGLDFTGLSGDCAMAFLFWPVTGVVVAGWTSPRWRVLTLATGMLLAVITAISRVLLHAHSVSEVVLGSIFGGLLGAAFLFATRRQPPLRPASGRWLPLAALFLLLVVSGRSFPFNRVLAWTARRVSGHAFIYTHCKLAPYTRACAAGRRFEYLGNGSKSPAGRLSGLQRAKSHGRQ